MPRPPRTTRRSIRTSSPAWCRRATRRSRCACLPSGTCASTRPARYMAHLIDRRLNDRGKSSVNRERFLRRYKSHVQEAVRRMVGERKLKDLEQGGEVRVPRKDVSEPSFHYGLIGDREHVLPGNREYIA